MAQATSTPSNRRIARKGAVVSASSKTIKANINRALKTRAPDDNAALVLADGTTFWGRGFGAAGQTVAEVCFNTSITGYQEILTDPSYAGQIITFTFPHIGNVGTNAEDIETTTPAARAMIVRADITEPSSWRSSQPLQAWLAKNKMPGISGIDTRALAARIRDCGAPNGALQYAPKGKIDIEALARKAANWPGLEGMDLAKEVTCKKSYSWTETAWDLEAGYAKQTKPKHHVVAIDFGAKHNILRCLATLGCKVTVVPANTPAKKILALKPDGIFLSNGPGDPAATGTYAVPIIQDILKSSVPVFGICLGHQLLARALGATTTKMAIGHRGANHPVQDLKTKRVEITSQNHGFKVDLESLPKGVEATHISLFDQSLEGLKVRGKPVFSVQYHPEASPGPEDSHHLFDRFVKLMGKN
ncbi:MAG: glutamine-hydrolyzing carbamoyl-phosphate synthase small subunit [Rhodospirillales bacterium]|jgi:carbamoyl-phosphate synthase small subunit|nr:glutamine-hydrolyzing carbamoyl-phosphate synthase small subunit [Rhodospirillales bacterium]MBT5075858.1 glutamine-hydrolyzing carbamoyl-phosphate synthase small subunit [Rhodospirillales bacterium]MBT5113127.1 glutamine-hydrolyzing carbamoyl-phosphate synthase small subunit [Rhodospirillales bacterium]MBT5673003.1 glutamine-hydrolyzing carbamoyl-phosphate synthase small subunit [Rhodospirillales bacterium]MBT6187680.1 glutamine-hydrolyzing carbamoyl-phosphate synthase small subunit [Rhodos